MTKQKFGGPWTVEKLGILSDYLSFYATALKSQPFDLIYIDAFAGTGMIKIGDEDEYEIIDGSAKLALQSSGVFAEYIFIEKKKSYVKELNELIDREFPEKKDRVPLKALLTSSVHSIEFVISQSYSAGMNIKILSSIFTKRFLLTMTLSFVKH